jgi:epoxyqueuosine reductase
MEGVRSIVVMAFPYAATPEIKASIGEGQLARYLWEGDDYHDRLHDKLREIGRFLTDWEPHCRVRGVVDTAPILEREYARLAGLGWQGKNTLLINKWTGSYFFLCCLLTDLELPYDDPHDSDHCGTCTRCLDACPTQAFPQPGVLDANRCISYLTIENRGPIPLDLRAGIGNWLFGCDICQEVCPWNRKASQDSAEGVHADELAQTVRLDELFGLDDETFRKRFRKTPLWRARRRGILRNAAIVLGNQRHASGLVPLAKGLVDSDPLVRGACVWAIGEIGGDDALAVLRGQAKAEPDATVLAELRTALEKTGRLE